MLPLRQDTDEGALFGAARALGVVLAVLSEHRIWPGPPALLLDSRAAGALSELCLQKGIRLLAYGTLCGGFLSDKWLNQPVPDLGVTS